MTTFSDGVYQYGGAPVGGGFYANPFGTHWFVNGNSGEGNNGFDGKAPNRAKATIDAAAQLMGVGDVCYIRPKTYVVGTGHARYEECATIDLAQSDLSFIGTGYSRDNEFGVRMKCDGTPAYCFDIYGPSCHIENIGLFSDGGTYTLLARNNGGTATQRGSDGITLYNVNSKGSPMNIQGGQAARVISCVFNNSIRQLIVANASSSGYNQQIKRCAFLASNGTAPTYEYIGAGGANVYDLWIDECYFSLIPTTSAYYIVIGGAQSVGSMTRCFFESDNLDTDTDISIASSSFQLAGCYDKTGLVDATND